jgi:hypothetical protein
MGVLDSILRQECEVFVDSIIAAQSDRNASVTPRPSLIVPNHQAVVPPTAGRGEAFMVTRYITRRAKGSIIGAADSDAMDSFLIRLRPMWRRLQYKEYLCHIEVSTPGEAHTNLSRKRTLSCKRSRESRSHALSNARRHARASANGCAVSIPYTRYSSSGLSGSWATANMMRVLAGKVVRRTWSASCSIGTSQGWGVMLCVERWRQLCYRSHDMRPHVHSYVLP